MRMCWSERLKTYVEDNQAEAQNELPLLLRTSLAPRTYPDVLPRLAVTEHGCDGGGARLAVQVHHLVQHLTGWTKQAEQTRFHPIHMVFTIEHLPAANVAKGGDLHNIIMIGGEQHAQQISHTH